MNQSKCPMLVPLALAVGVLFLGLGQGDHALAQNGNGKGSGKMPQMTPQQMMQQRVTPAQRKAAAGRLKAKKDALAAAGTLATTALAIDPTTGAMVPDYFGTTPNWAFSPPLTKFVDTLPDLKGLIAKPDVVTYPGSDYYEIQLVEYTNWKFHTALDPTRLRGYKQTNNGTNTSACTVPPAPPAIPPLGACTSGNNTVLPPSTPSYLGPVIVATKDRPTRIKFTNNLPTSALGGNLFIPTDTTVMGAGMGPDGTNYPQNRGTLHLHGGFTPWVSDGTPHQWVTPAGEPGTLTTGVSTQPVPDMPIPAGNSMTFYWPNQQSGRLMFYHDHAYGITRLNVQAGEAAGYLLRDDTEAGLETAGTIPGLADNIPLVIQDKTFVWGTAPSPCSAGLGTGTFATDPTWCDPIRTWGQAPGSLWFPHVYMTNQNPWDISGANAMGRWDYALWFWPPYTGLLANGTKPNPYASTGEPPEIPGTPNPSLVPEAFMDTPVVNGKAYPTLTVDAKKYRLRILNAANDRFWNLSLFVAADKTSPTTAGTTGAVMCGGSVLATNCTEVAMVPFNSSQHILTPFPDGWYTPGLNFTFDDRTGGVPDPRTRGPAMIQIGNEGGLLPAPAVILNQPVNYTYNRKDIVVLSVQEHALLLGPAERADLIVDFTKFAGKTLILYNDAPAPIPAADQRFDYYTGGQDQTGTGGAPPTLPGLGPNTRTVMQFVVGSGPDSTSPVDDYDPAYLTVLSTALPAAFATAQNPIIVPQIAYNAAYPLSPTAADVPGANVSRISDTSLTFTPLPSTANPLPTPLTFSMRPKAIQELFELDYGRMNATLGIELPFTNAGNQTTIPYSYIDPPTEVIDSSAQILPPTGGDGTQIWKITHNGVDTHAIHFHLFNVQVINRVGWDGAIRTPDPNELGWKETVRMNPLEDIIVALRPTSPQLPFGLPDSIRAMDVTTPLGTTGQFTGIDPNGNPVTVVNALVNFGWEYVWHCHLLGHEENDMMRPVVFNAPRLLPIAPVLSVAAPGLPVQLTWIDGTPAATSLGNPANEIGFRIQRATIGKNGKPGTYSQIGTALANQTTYADSTALSTVTYSYRVVAFNAAGTATSNAVTVAPPPLAPTNLVGTLQSGPQVRLTWTDNSNNQTGFQLERAIGAGGFSALAAPGANTTTYTDTTVTAGNTYTYRVRAVNGGGVSAYATSAPISLVVPAAPTPLAATAVIRNNNSATVTLTWPNVLNETGYTIQGATNSTFTAGLNTQNVAANTTTTTQNVNRGTSYWYRIQANNLAGSSAWVNATPFPILTP